MFRSRIRWVILVAHFSIVALGCTGPEKVQQPTLQPPAGSNASASADVQKGNTMFEAGRWERARQHYDLAVKTQPDLAEAHYNLALALERLGDHEQAHHHYIEAANLAPGHKIIWNSPPLRRHGNVPDKKGAGGPPVLPSLGGAGGSGPLGGLGGGGP